jgi:hypothetical protein
MSLRTNRSIRRAIDRTPDEWTGVIVERGGSATVSGEPLKCWVQHERGGQPLAIYNDATPHQAGRRVRVGRDAHDNRRRVIRGLYTAGTDQGVNPNVGLHAASHYARGGDPVDISVYQIVELRLSVVSGMTVRINSGFIGVNGQPARIRAQNIDLTSHIPETGARWVLIRASSAGALTVQDGDVLDSLADVTLANIPAVEAGYKALWAVRLYAGQTAVSAAWSALDFYPVWQAETGGGDASNITYAPATAADWEGDADPGNVDAALDQLAERMADVEATPPGSADASTTSYTPADTADWDGSADPGNVDSALDQLAERVSDLEAGGGSGTDFDLSTYSPYWWCKADTGITKDASNIVSQWDDQTAGARHATQSNASYKPQYVANARAGYGAISFDGVNDYLTTTAVPNTGTNGRTLLIVVAAALSASGGYKHLLHYGEANTGKAYGILASANSYSYGNHYWGSAFGTTAWGELGAAIVIATYDGTTDRWYWNGALVGENTVALNTGSTVGIQIGSRISAPAECGRAWILEAAAWSSVLSDSDRNAIVAGLKTKFGID